jgi:hypothetical protein
LSSKITIATGRASIIREPEWLKVPVLSVGREVMGVVQGGSISWQLGKRLELGL